MIGRVAERLSQLLDRGIDAVTKIDDGTICPQCPLNLVTGNDLTIVPQQHPEDLKWLFLKARSASASTHLACAKINFELSDAHPPSRNARQISSVRFFGSQDFFISVSSGTGATKSTLVAALHEFDLAAILIFLSSLI